MHTEIEPSLLARARRGDQQAFASFVRHYDAGLRALAFRLLGDRDRMDDALQEAYVRAFRALPDFRGDSAPGTWLYRIAYNACLDELWVPEGYRLAQVDVARARARPRAVAASTGRYAWVITLSYRRGLDQFLVTTRLRGSGTWRDPLAAPEGFDVQSQRVAIGDGALAGSHARLVLSPHTSPHVRALTDRLVVTVGGDLARNELILIANSLRGS